MEIKVIMINYTDKEIKDAINSMINDEKAFNACWNEVKEVIAKHIVLQLVSHHKKSEYGTLVVFRGMSEWLCPRCKTHSHKDSTYCGQCGNQLQDTWIEKIRKKNLGIN